MCIAREGPREGTQPADGRGVKRESQLAGGFRGEGPKLVFGRKGSNSELRSVYYF